MSISERIGRLVTFKVFTKGYWVGNCDKDHQICFDCNLAHCSDPEINFENCPHAIAMRKRREEDLITMERIMEERLM